MKPDVNSFKKHVPGIRKSKWKSLRLERKEKWKKEGEKRKERKKLVISFRERHYKVEVKYIKGRVGGSKDGEMGTD